MSSDPMGEAAAAHVVAARHPDDTRRILVTAAALVIAFASSYIPAPGINLDVIGGASGILASDADALARLSITALWVTPVISGLLLTEALKLAVPPQSALPEKNRSREAAFARFLIAVTLLIAAFQGYGMSIALESIQAVGGIPAVEDPGTMFRVSYIATQVAGVALLIALAGVITRHGIGSGLWVLLAASEIAALPSQLAIFKSAIDTGQFGAGHVLAIAGVTAGAIAAVVALYGRYAAAPGEAATDGRVQPFDILLPPLLGSSFATLVYAALTTLTFSIDGEQISLLSSSPSDPVWLTLVAIFVLFVAYLRGAERAKHATGQPPWRIIGAVTAAIVIAIQLLTAAVFTPPFSASGLIAAVLVYLTFRDRRLIE